MEIKYLLNKDESALPDSILSHINPTRMSRPISLKSINFFHLLLGLSPSFTISH